MSFITKRERVFNEYELFDIPARNEGKLKAYGSCTDTRAWSHFASDKTENLVEVIKRNNEKCATKYVPTKVIVETLMVTKNAEIARLKRKIGQFEQMIEVYDHLDLTNDQKNEIEKAHDAIKAANNDLDNMFLDLNTSGYTEGIDSEAFETGKSRADESHDMRRGGDEWSFDEKEKESKTVQAGVTTAERSTHVIDSRIGELQELIICKDAKLNAMRNTIAVMENDLCEPFCIYAQIYTAIERILGVLYQHDKYKEYLDLLVSGTDARQLDVKEKICFKMQVLEKFCLALIAPCSRGLYRPPQDCACYHAGVVTRIETTFALTSTDILPTAPTEVKRSHLVADIMDQTEMRDILSKSSLEDGATECTNCDNIDICLNNENLRRLRVLQKNYEDLMQCYETVKHERICLQLRCARYNELEYELEGLRSQMSEYNALWKQKEHYQKRSECMDELQEKYLLLYEESANLDTQLKAEAEINDMKSRTIAELRNENIALEKKLNECTIAFEKGQNTVECKLKEAECKCMCYEEQVKSLSGQIDRLLEQEQDQPEKDNNINCIYLLNEIETLKDQSKHLQDLLMSSDEEKHLLKEQFGDNLNNINELKMEIEHWKSELEKCHSQNYVLQKYIEKVSEENKGLKQDLEEKSIAVENLLDIIEQKKREVNSLNREVEDMHATNNNLVKQLEETQLNYTASISALEDEATSSLHLARTESASKIKENEELQKKIDDISYSIEIQTSKFAKTDEENRQLKDEIKKMSDLNAELVINRQEKDRKESEIMQIYQNLQRSFEKSGKEKEMLENEVHNLQNEIEHIKNSYKLNIEETDGLKNNYNILLNEKDDTINNLERRLNELLNENSNLKSQIKQIPIMEKTLEELSQALNDILIEKMQLVKDLQDSKNSLNDLRETVKNKTTENESLVDEINLLKLHRTESQRSIDTITKKNANIEEALQSLKEENKNTMEIIKEYENLQSELDSAKKILNEKNAENDVLLDQIKALKSELNQAEQKNIELHRRSTELFLHNETLETTIIKTRKEMLNAEHSSENDLCAKLYAQIQDMKNENMEKHLKLRELHDKLDELDNTNCVLNEDLQERENKIAIQQNHINELEYELRLLHASLNEAVGVSEEFKENADQKIDLSLKKMEAHHSKATHNMKMELAALESNRALLENQLSTTKLETEQTLRDKNKKLTQMQQLLNERKIIATEIKELELLSAGDTKLSPKNCEIEDILTAINNIREYLNKSTILEKRLSKAQSSHQLLLSKTEEAKKLIEQEKQKILYEKEEAINDRKSLENKLNELKLTLQNEKSYDEKVINDLKSELLNQKLIVKKIEESSQEYESQFEEKVKSLKSCQDRIDELQLKLKELSEQDNKKNLELEKVNNALKEKSNELSVMQEKLDKIKTKSYKTEITQTSKENNNDKKLQTDINDDKATELSKVEEENKKNIARSYPNMLKVNAPAKERKRNNLLSSQKLMTENDVQILTAQVEQKNTLDKDRDKSLKTKDFFERDKLRYESNPPPSELSQNNFTSFSKDIDPRQQNRHSKSQNQKKSNVPTNNSVKEDYGDIKSKSQIHKKVLDKSPGKEVFEKYENSKPSKSQSVKNSDSTITHILEEDNKNKPDKFTGQSPEDLYEKHDNAKATKSPNMKKVRSNSLTRNYLKEYNYTAEPGISQTSNNISDKSNSLHTEGVEKKTKPDKLKLHYNKSENSIVSPVQVDSFVSKSLRFSGSQESFDNNKIIAVDSSQTSTDENMIHIIKDYSSNNLNKKNINEKSELKSSNSYKSQTKSSKSKSPLRMKSHEASKVKPTSIERNKVEKVDFNKNTVDDSLDYIIPVKSSSQRNDGSVSLVSMADKKIIPISKINSSSTLRSMSEPNINVAASKVQKTENTPSQTKKLLKYPGGKSNVDYGYTKLETEAKNKFNLNENLKSKTDPSKKIHNNDLTKSTKSINDNLSSKPVHKNTKKTQQHTSRKEIEPDNKTNTKHNDKMDFGMKYVLDTIKNELEPLNKNESSENVLYGEDTRMFPNHHIKSAMTSSTTSTENTPTVEKAVMAKDESEEDYENRIKYLTQALENTKRDSKRRIDEIKLQYDNNIRSIINEHNQGVRNMQGLHEETLHDIVNVHENEVENLRSISIEALKKLEKLEKEKNILKSNSSGNNMHEDVSYPRDRRPHEKMLSKSIVQALDVTPKSRDGPCTCTVGSNLSDIVRKIFDQVDGEKRKLAEQAYLKYICQKFLNNNINSLDAQELSFLHFKVCRAWKHKLDIEEVLQKKIDSLETEVMTKQRNAYEYIAELDRRVAQEKSRLQEVREAVCVNTEYSGCVNSTHKKSNTTDDSHMDHLHLDGDSDYNNSLVKLLSEKEELSVGERSSAGRGLKYLKHNVAGDEAHNAGAEVRVPLVMNTGSSGMIHITSNINIDLSKYDYFRESAMEGCHCTESKLRSTDVDKKTRSMSADITCTGRRVKRPKKLEKEKDKVASSRRQQASSNQIDNEFTGEIPTTRRPKRVRTDNEKPMVVSYMEEHPERRGFTDELPTRLRRAHDAASARASRTKK